MSSSNGIGIGYTLPSTGNYHGQLFEYLKDNLSDPQLFYWHEILKKWLPLTLSTGGSGSSGGSGIVWDDFNL